MHHRSWGDRIQGNRSVIRALSDALLIFLYRHVPICLSRLIWVRAHHNFSRLALLSKWVRYTLHPIINCPVQIVPIISFSRLFIWPSTKIFYRRGFKSFIKCLTCQHSILPLANLDVYTFQLLLNTIKSFDSIIIITYFLLSPLCTWGNFNAWLSPLKIIS